MGLEQEKTLDRYNRKKLIIDIVAEHYQGKRLEDIVYILEREEMPTLSTLEKILGTWYTLDELFNLRHGIDVWFNWSDKRIDVLR